MQNSDQIAIIGPTASGKSALAVELAQKYNGIILSLDSLSIYKQIDIASAKPNVDERGGIEHYGIDVLEPDEHFDVVLFAKLYRDAKAAAEREAKNLIIVGGTSFYLKMLIDGISPLPDISSRTKDQVDSMLTDLPEAYKYLSKVDSQYANRIKQNDRYRIEKALLIHISSGIAPTEYFATHPPQPIIDEPLPIYEITVDKELLRERIMERTERMLSDGLIDEVCMLECTYTRAPAPMKAIGIKEVLDYLDGIYSYDQMREKIITHTARLAKRQRTFNASQFDDVIKGSLEELKEKIQES